MHDMRCLLVGLAAAALSLTACSSDDAATSETASSGSEFDRLIEDAQFEIGEGNLAEAGRLFDQALALEPTNPALWVQIARLRYRGGEHSGALEAAQYALQLDPKSPEALLMRAQLVRDAHGLVPSLAWFESALSNHPEDADLLAEYAGTLGDAGRHRDMLKAVRALAEVDPRDPRVHYLQAVLAARGGDPVLASSLLKRSGLRDAGVPSALMLGALVDMQQSTYDNAVTTLEQLLELQPANVRVTELLARALWLNGRDRELVERFEESASREDASAYLVMLVGRSLERLGKRAEAEPFIARARILTSQELVPLTAPSTSVSGIPAVTQRARQFVTSGQESAALRYSAELRKDFPQSADVAVLAGDGALASGDPELALSSYSRAAQIRRSWPLTKKIIHAYKAAGDNDAADALLIRHVKSEPHNVEAIALYAKRASQQDDWVRVAVLLDTAFALGAESDIELLDLRVQTATELGETDRAEELEARLLKLRPPPLLSK